MTHYSTLSNNLKRQILSFSERVSQGLSRPDFKFVAQMIYGILGSQSCHLSKIARALDEPISLKKTIDRLSRNLAGFKGYERIHENYIGKVKGSLSSRAILVVDDGDITKPCSFKLEGLGRVKDGSTGEYGIGYHMLDVTALTPKQKSPIGVYSRVYSAREEEFESATVETLEALRYLSGHFRKSMIRAFDRGFDANTFYEYLIDRDESFVIRAKKNRDVIYKGERQNIMKVADRYKGKYGLRFKKKNRKEIDCKISIAPIRLCCRPEEELNLVVCRGLGQEPMLLVTNLKSDDEWLAATITKVYFLRWKIEEWHGFKKQQFGFEDLRVRSLRSIRNLDLLLTIAMGYIGIMSEKADEKPVVMELLKISKRIYGISKFKLYAMADGLFTVFAQGKQGVYALLKKKPKDRQMSLLSYADFARAVA